MISVQEWKKVIGGGMEELLVQYNASPEDKVPVQYIGPQVKEAKTNTILYPNENILLEKYFSHQIQLWSSRLQEFSPDQLFYFYNERDVSMAQYEVA